MVAGPVLFLFPGDTGPYFASKIGNPLTLQLLGALLNNDHFDGPSWSAAVYLAYSALLGLAAASVWAPALLRRAPPVSS